MQSCLLKESEILTGEHPELEGRYLAEPNDWIRALELYAGRTSLGTHTDEESKFLEFEVHPITYNGKDYIIADERCWDFYLKDLCKSARKSSMI